MRQAAVNTGVDGLANPGASDALEALVTIDAVGSFFPERVMTVEERAMQLELNPAETHMFRRFHGLDRMHYDPEVGLYELVLPAAQKVLAQVDPRSVRYVIHCQTDREAEGTANIADDLKRLLSLDDVTAFTLTQQNCALSLTAIDIAGALLRNDGDLAAHALVVTGDKPRSRESQLLANTCMVADGAASCLVSLNGPGAVVRSLATSAKGEYSDGFRMSVETARAHIEELPRNLLGVMEEAASRAGYKLDDIQMIVPTNPNLSTWPEVVKNPELRSKFFVDNVPRYSHCLAADVLINYTTLLDERRFDPQRPSMFIAIGVGMTFSAMVFTPSADMGVSL
ncbi:3-oxoacyl-[acyl-carrier-protein] synthase III C-terminal domain-containing protein [Nocardia panacis]|nr:3-oxoacyl-[acyl-carrier-protein] synthase III C-terminal domain-containing protein [Nocardia panacis]